MGRKWSRVHLLCCRVYGRKFAALSALKAIEAGSVLSLPTFVLKIRATIPFTGVASGDSWISPEDFTSVWGPLLKDVYLLDNNGLQKSNCVALQIKQQVEAGDFSEATDLWNNLEVIIDQYDNTVESGQDPVSLTASELKQEVAIKRWGGKLALVLDALNSDFMSLRYTVRLMNY